MAILAVVDDLLFRAKIEQAAAHQQVAVRLVPAAGAERAAREQPWTSILLDLGAATQDPLMLVAALRAAAPAIPIIGFCSHVETALQRAARAAGCTHVLPRSVFVQRLPELLDGK